MNLKHLTDTCLLNDTKELAYRYRQITTQLLHHLKEIDERKLYCELGYSTLFLYVVQELGFSESSASRRISAMRLLKEIPDIEKKIESGDLTLSHIGKAANVFKKENVTDVKFKKEILNTIENTSTRVCEQTLSEIIKPNALPFESPQHVNTVVIAISNETFEKHEEIRGLLAHHHLSKDAFYSKIFDIVISHLKVERFKINSTKESTSKNPRYITAAVKKAVYLRDKVCQKCGTKYGLQYDHRKPYALGGKSTKENIRLLCRNCNQRARISSNLHFP